MAKSKKNIDQVVNDSFQSEELDLNDFSWNDVKSKLDASTTVDKVVFSALNPHSAKLPDGAWANMNDALDVETVWKRLEKRPKRKPLLFWWKIAGVLLIIGVLVTQIVDFNTGLTKEVEKNKLQDKTSTTRENNAQINAKEQQAQNEPTFLISKGQVIANNNIAQIEQEEEMSSQSYVMSETVALTTDTENTIQHSTGLQNETSEKRVVKSVKKDKLVKFSPKGVKLFQTVVATEVKPIKEVYYDSTVNFSPHKIIVGIVGTYQNTWIFDTETRLGFSENSNEFNDFTFSSSIGFFLNYKLKQNYSVDSELFFNSTQKTKNNLFIEGNLTKKETSINYLKYNLLLAKDIPFGKNPIQNAIQLSAGGYFSYLKGSSIHYFDRLGTTSEIGAYKSFDYGVSARISYKKTLERFTINAGIRSSYGINNIYKGTSDLPSLFNETHNISFGAHLRIGYKL